MLQWVRDIASERFYDWKSTKNLKLKIKTPLLEPKIMEKKSWLFTWGSKKSTHIVFSAAPVQVPAPVQEALPPSRLTLRSYWYQRTICYKYPISNCNSHCYILQARHQGSRCWTLPGGWWCSLSAPHCQALPWCTQPRRCQSESPGTNDMILDVIIILCPLHHCGK